jgi:hypothetical protein
MILQLPLEDHHHRSVPRPEHTHPATRKADCLLLKTTPVRAASRFSDKLPTEHTEYTEIIN